MIFFFIVVLSMIYSAAAIFVIPFVCSEREIQSMLNLQLVYFGIENSTKMRVAN